MNNRKAFTLIELLAVIIILGLLMAIAVGGVGKYIEDSRKKMYIATAESYLSEIIKKTTSLEYSFFDEDTTYYVHIDNIDLEKGGLSPYGDGQWLDAWIALTYNGNEYSYYWVSVDSSSQRVDLAPANELDKNLVHASKQTTINNREPIGTRSMIYIIDKDGQIIQDSSRLELTLEDAEECYSYSEKENGAITINFYQASCPKDVVVPAAIDGKEVTDIYQYTFSSKSIKSLVLPNTIKRIGVWAFAYNKISNLVLPSNLNSIAMGAFRNNEISDISFNSELISISSDAFRFNHISKIDLPSSVSSIGTCAFSDNPIPNPSFMYSRPGGVTDYSVITGYIGDLTEFENKTFVIPAEVDGVALKTIGAGAFSGMSLSEWTVQIPETVTSIGDQAFNASGIKTVNLPSGLKTIGTAAFYSNRITSIKIPSSVTSIGYYAFNNNRVTDSEDIWVYKRTAQGIDYSSIISYAGANRANIVIPETKNGVALKTFGQQAFSYLSLSGTLKIPSTVTNIPVLTFSLNNLTAVDNGDGNLSRGSYIFQRNPDASIDYTNIISYAGYRTDVVIPEGVKTISDYAFHYTYTTSIDLPEGLTYIGRNAFSNCLLKGTITIPSTVNTIGVNSFTKAVSSGSFNVGLNKIINKTGRAFNWAAITGNQSPATGNIVTGTVENWYGDIEITDK